MLSRSNFAAVALVMVAVFVLFQFTGMSSSSLGQGTTNPNGEASTSLSRESAEHTAFSGGEGKETILLVAEKETGTSACVRESASYLKRPLRDFSSVAEAAEAARGNTVVVVASGIDWKSSLTSLEDLGDRGVPVIFAQAPTGAEMANSYLARNYLGVASVEAERTEISGLRIFQGFLLGGETVYDEYELKAPYYRLKPGARVYTAGLLKDQEEKDIDNEDLPALVWRYSEGKGAVYVCAGPFLEDHSGLGFLTGLLCQLDTYSVYPVVNAQTVLLQNFPFLSEENTDEMTGRYSRSSDKFFQEQLWPSVVAILRNNGEAATCCITPRLDYASGSQPKSELLSFYLAQLAREGFEAGVSGGVQPQAAEKLTEDFSLYSNIAPDYRFTVFAPGGLAEEHYSRELKDGGLLSQVRTLVKPFEELDTLISYGDENLLQYPLLHEGEHHTQEDDLRLRSLESALGLSSVGVDFEQIVYPEEDEDDWVTLGVDWARFSDTYWKPFRGFDSVLVSEADQRVRRFLALDYTLTARKQGVSVDLTGFEKEAWFLFRSESRELQSVSGGSFEKLEEGCYLIHAEQAHLELLLKEMYSPYYYES